ncbi:MAG: SurA N-terminal domain-containing protein [Candidatus Methylomirabilia bacterium]
MIGAMRRNIKTLSIFLWLVIAAFIGTTFLVWGRGSITGTGGPGAVATVNGEEIPLERYQRRYQDYLAFYQQLYRDRFSSELARRLGLSRQVLDELVREELVIQRAKAEGITVGDAELNARIHSIGAFQQNGQFSLERYREILQRERMTPPAFESELRRAMLRQKAERLVKGGIKVSEAELRQAYALDRERVRAAWILVELEPFLATATATEPEIEAYLKEHSAEFRQPERRRIEYVVVKPKDFVQPVTGAEVEAYYRERGAEFEQPRQVRAAHILVRVPEVGGSEAERRARAKVEEAIRRARAGEGFAELAKEISEDPASAGAGGDMGYIAPGELVAQFEQALFALRKGEITKEPVRTAFGYHAIKALEIREGGRRPLKEVASEIRERLQAERSDEAARQAAAAARAKLQTAEDFIAEARKLGLAVSEILYARGTSLEGIGWSSDLEEAAFTLVLGGVSRPLETAGGYVVLKVTEHLPSQVPPLAEIRDRVAGAVKRRKAEAEALARASALASAAAIGKDALRLAKEEGFPTGETSLFSRSDLAEARGVPEAVMRGALKTPVGQLGEPVKTAEGVYLVETVERRAADPSGFEAARPEIEKQLLEGKRDQTWRSWVDETRSRATVEVPSQLPGTG